jgi:hypothetical protein
MAFIQVETKPKCEPVSLADMKTFLRITDTDQDSIIARLISAAREYCETFTGRAFINTGFKQVLDSFPYFTDTVASGQAYPPAYYSLPRYSTTLWNYSQMMKLLRSPLAAVDHIMYVSGTDGRPKALTLSNMSWYPLTDFASGAKVVDSNGKVQTCTTAGKSGKTEPTWATATNGTTPDGSTLIWTNSGVVDPGSDFVADDVSEPPRIFPRAGQYWPACLYVPNAVEIHFTAGYNDDAAIAAAVATFSNTSPAPNQQEIATYEAGLRQADVPEVITTAIFEFVSHWYEHREAITSENLKEAPKTVDMLLWSERVLDMAPTRG